MNRKHVLIPSKIEYVSHACNFAIGCAHGCRYCYMPKLSRIDRARWREARAVPFAVALLEADLDRLKEKPTEVLVSSSHDPCQPDGELADLTEDILAILARHDMPVWMLTKGGLRSLRYLDLLKRGGARLGVTITTHDEAEREWWEPGAASIHDRFMALVNAKARGMATWASVEPVLPGLDIPKLARQLEGLADFVVVGKWNYSSQAAAMDWPRIRETALEAFEGWGGDLLVKSELAEA